jgi:starvation-inducible DNA-binding protein
MTAMDMPQGRNVSASPPDVALLNSLRDVASALTILLADLFALYLKTKGFHWHVSGPHFRDYHLLFDEQSSQILAATESMAGRVRKRSGEPPYARLDT